MKFKIWVQQKPEPRTRGTWVRNQESAAVASTQRKMENEIMPMWTAVGKLLKGD